MVFRSKIFGEIEIDEKEVFEFPAGLIGFPNHKKFFFLKPIGLDLPFPVEIMHSFDDSSLAFFVVDPSYLSEEYFVISSQDHLKDIDIEDPADAVLRIIVRFEGGRMVANFLTPIVLNLKNRKAKHVILDGPEELLKIELDLTKLKEKVENKRISQNKGISQEEKHLHAK